MHHCTWLLVEMGSHELPARVGVKLHPPDLSLSSASQVARITDVSHSAKLVTFLF
jgi:hypothetical protein